MSKGFTPEDIAQMDQGMALFTDTMPPALRRFYVAENDRVQLIKEGFSGVEALRLTVAWLRNFQAKGGSDE